MIFFGTSTLSALEARDYLAETGQELDAMRLLAFPFHVTVKQFIDDHDVVYVIEQNRDAQMRSLLINELEVNPKKLVRVLNYDGMPITANDIAAQIKTQP